MGAPGEVVPQEPDGEEGGSSDETEGDEGLFGLEAEAAADAASAGTEEDCSVQSLFGPETFDSASAFWRHATEVHGFSLVDLRERIGRSTWTDYHRIRLVNYLRSLGPEAAKHEALLLDAGSGLWSDDSLLQPVLEDDGLLFEDDGLDSDDDDDEAARKMAAMEQADPTELVAEIERLRAELASTRRLLTEADVEDDKTGVSCHGVSCSSNVLAIMDDPLGMERCRALVLDTGLGEAFRQFVVARPELLQGKTVLDAGCSAGVLSCLCVKLGARTVVAVDPSASALALARSIVTANHFNEEVCLLHGFPDDSGLALPSCGKGHWKSGGKGHRKSGGQGGQAGSQFDALISGRLLSDLRYSPDLLRVLAARRRHLKPGGWVLPGRVVLCIAAADFSAEACDTWWRQHALDGLDLGALAPEATSPPACDASRVVEAARIASVQAAELLALDLADAAPEEAVPSQVPFRLTLKPDSLVTALVLYLDADLGPPGTAVVSMAPTALTASAAAGAPPAPPRRQTVLHLPAPRPSPSRGLRLCGAEFPVLEGCFSGVWAPDSSHLQVSVEITARRGDGGPSAYSAGTFVVS